MLRPSDPEPVPHYLEPMVEILARYVSTPTANGIVKLARARVSGDVGLDRSRLREMLEPIGRNLELFVPDPARRGECVAALGALVGRSASEPGSSSLVLAIRAEDDIARARVAARDLAVRVGFTANGQTRLVTAVSELARNVFQYAGEGRIELRRSASPGGVEIVATDRGPGIPNLDDILAGNYRSKQGMGLGLRGVKRLAQRFDVQTAPGRGTTVTVSMRVT